MIAINSAFVVLCAWVALTSCPGSVDWWLNLTASAMNAAIVMYHYL